MAFKNSSPINMSGFRVDRRPMAQAAAAKASIWSGLGKAVQTGIQAAQEKKQKKAQNEAVAGFLKKHYPQLSDDELKNVDHEIVMKAMEGSAKINQAEKLLKLQEQQAETARQAAAAKARRDAYEAARDARSDKVEEIYKGALTTESLARAAALKNSPPAMSSREEVIQDNIRTHGLTRQQAIDLEDGWATISRNEVTGQPELVNKRNGSVTVLNAESKSPIDSTAKRDYASQDFYNNVEGATGLMPAAREKAQGIVGGVLGSIWDPEIADPKATEVRQQFKSLQQNFVRAMVNNSRFPEGEVKRILEENDISPGIAKDKHLIQGRMRGLAKALEAKKSDMYRAASDPNTPAAQKQDAIQAARSIDDFLYQLNVPEAEKAETQSIEALINKYSTSE